MTFYKCKHNWIYERQQFIHPVTQNKSPFIPISVASVSSCTNTTTTVPLYPLSHSFAIAIVTIVYKTFRQQQFHRSALYLKNHSPSRPRQQGYQGYRSLGVYAHPGGSLNMVPWYASTCKKTTKKGNFCHRLVGSRDLQKGGIFAKKARCLTEDTLVTPIKGVLW